MLDASKVELQAVLVHRIGNKLRQEGITFSENPLNLTRAQVQPLLYYFFNHFEKNERTLRLAHPVGLGQNAVFAIASRIFKGASLADEGRKAAEHLYDVSEHPKINSGNLFIAYFHSLNYEGKNCDAIGFFKSDHIDQFLNVDILKGKTTFSVNSGTRVKSFDKGALILNRSTADGFRVLQAVSHSDEAAFWTDRFLKTEEVASDSTHTRDLVRICKDYAETISTDDSTGKMQFLERAYTYLTDNKKFSESAFIAALPSKNRSSFSEFSKKSKDNSGFKIPNDFEVAPSIVKKHKKLFRSVITLDDQIEIKINPDHLDKSHKSIEKGYDERLKKSFYKIYFTEES